MTIEVKQGLTPQEELAIQDILFACAHEFVPPLGQRTSSTQSNMTSGLADEEKPYSYFQQMIAQEYILAKDGDKVVGFMTYKPQYTCPELSALPLSSYITTTCVYTAYRGNHILQQLYQAMEAHHPVISTRTWSTNVGHLHVLESRGYTLIKRLVDHRGVGIDTVYYAKQIH